jgi:DNA-binding transcriptional LysR family regulator
MCLESPELVKAAVRTGKVLGILDRNSLEIDLQVGNFRIVSTDFKMCANTFIIFHKETPISPNTKDFLDLLRQRHKIDRSQLLIFPSIPHKRSANHLSKLPHRH